MIVPFKRMLNQSIFKIFKYLIQNFDFNVIVQK